MSLLALRDKIAHREPDRIIGSADHPYMRRWYIIPRNPLFNVYLHQFLRSDDDRALHDHPWWNCSILIDGRYVEHTIDAGGISRRVERRAGAFKIRWVKYAHRIELFPGETCWTVFITGPRFRIWGFHCRLGWRDWREFTNTSDGGATIGRGCEDLE